MWTLSQSSLSLNNKKSRLRLWGALLSQVFADKEKVIFSSFRNSLQLNRWKTWSRSSKWRCDGAHVQDKIKTCQDRNSSWEKADSDGNVCGRYWNYESGRQKGSVPSEEGNAEQPLFPKTSLPSEAKEEKMSCFHYISPSIILSWFNLLCSEPWHSFPSFVLWSQQDFQSTQYFQCEFLHMDMS